MQEDKPHNNPFLHQQTIKQIRQVISNPKVHSLLISQLQMLPKNTYQIYVAYQKIYVIVNFAQYIRYVSEKQEGQKEPQIQAPDMSSKYAIKISKSFPLKNSVKIHLLDGTFMPKISDIRDLFQQLMGKPYHYTIHLLDIFDKIIYFNKTLRSFNENYLDMQKLGCFTLGEKYYYHQLCELYSSLMLFKDYNSKKNGIYVGLSETHLLVFRELETDIEIKKKISADQRRTDSTTNERESNETERREETFNELQLICYAQMQCIDTIFYRENEKHIKVVFKKYQSIKLYHEFEQIKRYYKFQKPELFLRGVLKSITKFQSCDINFQPFKDTGKKDKDKKPSVHDNMVKHRQNQRINFYVEQANKHELELQKQTHEPERKKHLQQIQKYFTKLIEFYSARTNPYYLIYVNKLNNLYSKHFVGNRRPEKEEKSGQKDREEQP